MTYNVRYFGHGTRGLASTTSAIWRIAEGLARLNPLPDIICLQEVETMSLRSSAMAPRDHSADTQLAQVMNALRITLARQSRENPYSAYYFPAHAYRLTANTNIYTTGLAVLATSDFQVDHHNAERPHDITHRRRVKNLKQTRICAHISLTHRSGSIIDVFNTHLSLPGLFYREFWTKEARMGFGPNQLEEARALGEFVKRERRGDHFLVVGDFNALPGSPVDEYLREEHAFVDAFPTARGITPAQARAWPTAGFLNLRMHLDHMYSSPSLEWVDFEETHPFGAPGAFAGLSDHVPIIGRCRIA